MIPAIVSPLEFLRKLMIFIYLYLFFAVIGQIASIICLFRCFVSLSSHIVSFLLLFPCACLHLHLHLHPISISITVLTVLFRCNILNMITLEGGNPVAATMEIIGSLNVTSVVGDVYMTGVDSTSDVNVHIGTGNVHGSAIVAQSIAFSVGIGNIGIIELFLGNVFALIPGLFPGGASSDKPFVHANVGRGDITIEGLQGLKSPADSGNLDVNLNAGGGGNIKVIVNANGFLGRYELLTSQGKVGVEIEGNEPTGAWTSEGCVPLPSDVLNSKPPQNCANAGILLLNSTYGDLEFVVDTGS